MKSTWLKRSRCAASALFSLMALAAPATAASERAPVDYTKVAGLSQPVHDTERKSFEVPMSDGINLYVEVVKPKGDGAHPVILEASPYHGTVADRDGTRIFPDPRQGDKKLGLTGYFAPRGYSVVIADLRGTGRSEGCLDHLGPKDGTDLKTIVEWAAAQPWSNGRVGMTGHSYVGSTPMVAAAQKPRGLVTIAPSAGLASMYDHQFQSGVPYYLQYIGPMVAYELLAIDRHLPPGGTDPGSGGRTGDNFGNDPQYAGCGLPNSAATAGSGQVTGQYEGWHKARDWRAGAAAADIPVFMIHGVNDNAARIPAAEWFFKDRYAGEVPGEDEDAGGNPDGGPDQNPPGRGTGSDKPNGRENSKKTRRRGGERRSESRGRKTRRRTCKKRAGESRRARGRRCRKAGRQRAGKQRARRATAFVPPRARVRDKVWLGQWDHGSSGAGSRCAEASNREGHPNCRFGQWQYALHAWFDRTLQGREVDTGPDVEVFLNDKLVHTDRRWRPFDAPLTLHASGTDKLTETPPAEEKSTSFRAAPRWMSGNYVDFTSEPVSTATTFVGVPQMRLAAATSGPTQLVATLYEQDAAGKLDLDNPVTVCALQPLLREGIDKVTPVTPGQRMVMAPQCFTAAHVLAAGERLVLRVSAAHRESGSHHAPTLAADPQVTVFTGGKDGTAITVPRAAGARLYPDVR